ncbi:hypothetical protein TRVL_03029 [Trypanosoma vivax]|nr:hypothetical protein TRVL_03029 [Trypanosoma vivax]
MPRRQHSVLHPYLIPLTCPTSCHRAQQTPSPPAAHAESSVDAAAALGPGDHLESDELCGRVPLNSKHLAAVHHRSLVGGVSLTAQCGGLQSAVYRKRSRPRESEEADEEEEERHSDPLLPSARTLDSLPPSCLAVRHEPNWLERALMLARGGVSGRTAPCNGSVSVLHRTSAIAHGLPDPAMLRLDSTSDAERRVAVAVAQITADFYAAHTGVEGENCTDWRGATPLGAITVGIKDTHSL